MTITIELADKQEAYVTAIARQRGMAVHDVVAQMIDAHIGAGDETMPSGVDQGDEHYYSSPILAVRIECGLQGG